MGRTLPQTSYAAVSGAGYDKCWTPWHGAAPLLPYLPKGARIWECCAGDGWLAKWLEEDGHTTIQTDYVTGHDALHYAPDPADYDLIVTNPPWSLKYKFIKRLYELGKPWAMLVPFNTISVPSAKNIRDAHGGAWEELQLDKRINFSMPNTGFRNAGAQVMSMWLCFRILPRAIIDASVPAPRPEHRLTKPAKKAPKVQPSRTDVLRWVRDEGVKTDEQITDLIMRALASGIPMEEQSELFERAA